MWVRIGFVAGAVLVGVGSGCGTGAVTKPLVETPTYDGGAKCAVKSSQSRPLIVEWPTADRAALERKLKQGVVPVRYDGCEMELLDSCRAKPSYQYVAITPKHDQVVIRDADELYASLPLGAASLEAKLERSGQLNVAMMVVGAWESRVPSLARTDLEGDCKRATHTIAALTVGAFDFYAGGKASVGASAGALGVRAGGASSSERERLLSDGSLDACGKASVKDTAPPDGCGAPIRVEVLPLGETRVVPPVPTLDLGEIGFHTGIQKPTSWLDVSVARIDHALVTAELVGDARAAWKSVFDMDVKQRDIAMARQKAYDALEACRQRGACDEKKLSAKNAELEKKSQKLSDERGEKVKSAVKRLSKLVNDPKKPASAATLYALANLERGMLLYDEAGDPARVLAPVLVHYSAAATNAPVETSIGWFARYDQAIAASDLGKYDQAIRPLEELVRGPERPGKADAAYRLGQALDAVGRTSEAVDAYQAASAQGKPGPVLAIALWSLVNTAFRAERWKDSLEAAIRLYDVAGPEWKETLDEVRIVAAQNVLRLGGIEREQLRTASPRALEWIGMAYAANCLERYDLLGAAGAWELVVERSPNTLSAPLALSSLAAVYEELGDAERTAAARKKLAGYTLGGAWAEALRKTRGADGQPDDEALRRALATSAIPIPKLPKTDAERKSDVSRRSGALVSSCMSSAARLSGKIAITATVAHDKPVSVTATVVEDRGELKAVARCIQRDGAFFFSGATNGAKLVAKFTYTE